MKKISFFILFIFTLLQVVPAIHTLTKENNVLVFNLDQEKADTNEKKEKNDYSSLSLFVKVVSAKASVSFHFAEKINTSPCLEKLTPPPNFC